MVDTSRLLLRAELRRHWPAYVGIAVIVALTGAVAMASLAGARRTASAFERHLEASRASDLGINVRDLQPPARRALAGLPGVESVRSYAGVLAEPIDPATGERLTSSVLGESLISVDGRFLDQDRAAMLEGRLPDPSRADEALINRTAADETGLGVGDRLALRIFHPQFYEPIGEREVTITGIGLTAEEIAVADIDDIQRVILTPAFLEENPDAIADCDECYTYYWSGLRLRPGTDPAEVEAAWENTAGNRLAGERLFRYRRASTLEASVQRSIRPQIVALGAFGTLAALLALALTAQAVRRAVRSSRPEAAVLRALGASRLTSSVGSALAATIAVAGGTVLAIAGAVALSPLTPIGPVRPIEADPGLDVDGTVLLLGAAALLAVGGATAFATARRLRSEAPGPALDPGDGLRLPPVLGLGVRFALGRRSAAARSALVGAVLATVAVAGTLAFGADLRHLTTTGPLFGANFDAALQVGAGYAQFDPAALDRVLEGRDDDLVAWASLTNAILDVEGVAVPVLGVDHGRGTVQPSVVEGRAPNGSGEVLLAEETLDRVGAEVGDEVDIEGTRFTVVGTGVLPALGQATGDHPGLGVGGWLSASELRALIPSGEDMASAILLRTGGGTDVDRIVAALEQDPSAWGVTDEEEPGDLIQVLAPPRPAELVGTSSSIAAPTALTAALVTGALAALGFSLVASVRGRRRDLAVLKTVGFVRHQVVGAVATQAAVIVVVGGLVGIPLGLALGSTLWRLFADQLGVISETVVPVLGLTLAGLGGLVAAVVLAALPSRAAARTPAALVLRSE